MAANGAVVVLVDLVVDTNFDLHEAATCEVTASAVH